MVARIQNSLRLRTMALLFFFSAGLSSHLYFFWVPALEHSEAEQLRTITDVNAVIASEMLSPYLLQNHLAAIHEVLDELRETNGNWVYVELADARGQRLYPLDQEPRPERRFLHASVQNITIQDKKIATLAVVVDLRPSLVGIYQAVRSLTWMLCVAICLLCCILWMMLEQTIRRPIRHLASAATALADGDYGKQLPAPSTEEIGTLSNSFRRMRDELRAQRESLEQAVQDAESASRVKDRFLASISHELRTPIGAILGYADLLDNKPSALDKQLDAVSIVKRNSQHLLELVNQLLDLAKIESDELLIDLGPTELSTFADEVVKLLAVPAAERSIALVLKQDVSLPACVTLDPMRVRQVLINLIGNAIKFTDGDQVTLRISRVMANGQARLQFIVEDTGPGIPEDELEQIFSPFVQGEKGRNHASSTGLGLAVSSKLAALLDGRLWVRNNSKGGATFTLELPLVVAERPAQSNSVQRDERADLTGLSILLAEDFDDFARLMVCQLTDLGAQVARAANGREAIALLESQRQFDICLMDMQMPECTGYEATAELRARGYTLPIVALTANAMKGDRERFIQVGCNDYLTKPIALPALTHKIVEIVGRPANRGETIVDERAKSESDGADALRRQMAQLAMAFASALPARLDEFVSAYEQDDTLAAQALAHRLAGTAGMYGFAKLGSVARIFDEAVANCEPRQHIDDAYGQLCSALQHAMTTGEACEAA